MRPCVILVPRTGRGSGRRSSGGTLQSSSKRPGFRGTGTASAGFPQTGQKRALTGSNPPQIVHVRCILLPANSGVSGVAATAFVCSAGSIARRTFTRNSRLSSLKFSPNSVLGRGRSGFWAAGRRFYALRRLLDHRGTLAFRRHARFSVMDALKTHNGAASAVTIARRSITALLRFGYTELPDSATVHKSIFSSRAAQRCRRPARGRRISHFLNRRELVRNSVIDRRILLRNKWGQ